MKNPSKSRIAILCVLTLLISLSAAGCGSKPQENASQPNSSQNSSAEDSSSQNKPLAEEPASAEDLRTHQYGGIILFGSNVIKSEQTVRLIADLQSNNAESADAAETGVIPYLIAADQEGGSVARLSMGTRGTGSMTVGAFNANVPAALRAIFGEYEMTGRLPINIPIMEQDADGQWIYSDTILYERGFQCS